jgi:hypothetical protein
MLHRQLETFLDECQRDPHLSLEELASLQELLTEAIAILKNVIYTPPLSSSPVTFFVPPPSDDTVESMDLS